MIQKIIQQEEGSKGDKSDMHSHSEDAENVKEELKKKKMLEVKQRQ